jgi:O-antigen/teichoic acid export membrane protein
MQWDLGAQGLALLAVMSLAFGAFTQLVFIGRGVWWVGIVAAAASFLVGLFVSEVLFGWATEVELQPNIDGLSFDEVLITYLIGGVIVLVTRYVTRDRRHEPMPA